MSVFHRRKPSALIYRRERKGYWFVAPFAIGFFLFILFPMLQSLIYSFNNVSFDGALHLDFIGLENYRRAFLVDTEYRELLVSSVGSMLISVPIILIFSAVVAVFLNGTFPGRSVYQIIFFIPVIVSSGILPELLSSDMIRQSIINVASTTTSETVSSFDTTEMTSLLMNLNFPAGFVNYIMYAITNILEVVNSSGIQILVFLIALKSIPQSLYEASSIEGATAWESFWRITFPMILPQALVNVTYTIIDAFVNNVNPVMESISEYNYVRFQFGYAAGLSWAYFLIILVITFVLTGILRKAIRHYA